MAKAAKGTTGNTRLPDDIKRHSLLVPMELWKHVERWAKEQDKSETAIVRACIEQVRDQAIRKNELRIAAMEFFREVHFQYHIIEELCQNLVSLPAPPDIPVKHLKPGHLDLRAMALKQEITKAYTQLRDAHQTFQSNYVINDGLFTVNEGPDSETPSS